MNSLSILYITLVSLSGILNIFLGIYAFFRKKDIQSAFTFILYTVALSIYCFGYAFELASDTLWKVKLWTAFEYMGMAFSVPLGLIIVFQYLGKRVPRGAIVALLIIPAITCILVATNDLHHFYYRSFTLVEGSTSPVLRIEIAEWYIVFHSYTFCCWLGAVILLLGRWKQTKWKPYRIQLFTLMCAQLSPMFLGLLYLFGVTPEGLDPVPMGLCITAALYIWAILSSKMLTMIPIAKETVFDNIGEGVIILDSAERLIDYNRAAKQMIPSLSSSMIGGTLDQVWPELTATSIASFHQSDDSVKELSWISKGTERFYEVRSSAMQHHNSKQAGSLLMLIDVTELKWLQQKLEHQAFYDGLTQILNRTQFIVRSQRLYEESRSQGKPFTVVIFDIDLFKRVNDNYGHNTGDKLIVHVVSICSRMLSEDILFGRYGGEEFVLALPSYTLHEGNKLAERLRKGLEAEPLQMEGETIAVTSSFGVAMSESKYDETLDVLLNKADEALYMSKRNGRNRVTITAN